MKKSLLIGFVLFATAACKKDQVHSITFHATGIEKHCSINGQEVKFDIPYLVNYHDHLRVSSLYPVNGIAEVRVYEDNNLIAESHSDYETINLCDVR